MEHLRVEWGGLIKWPNGGGGPPGTSGPAGGAQRGHSTGGETKRAPPTKVSSIANPGPAKEETCLNL